MKVKTFDKFIERTGMITDSDLISELGFPTETENGAIDTSLLNKLKKFCLNNPKYHIITCTDDGDSLYYENGIRIVNRLLYYLGTGDKNNNLFYREKLDE